MRAIGSQVGALALTPATQNPADTTGAHTEVASRFMHRRHGWRGIVGGVVWLAIVVYVLWLATRFVRAIEKFVDTKH